MLLHLLLQQLHLLNLKIWKWIALNYILSTNKDTLALIIICCSGGHQELLNCYFEILATVNGLRILIVVTGMLHLNLKGILRIGSCCHFLLCSCHFVSVYSISYLFLNTEFDCAGVYSLKEIHTLWGCLIIKGSFYNYNNFIYNSFL